MENSSKHNLCQCYASAGIWDIPVCSKKYSESTVNVGHSPLFYLPLLDIFPHALGNPLVAE